MKPEAPGVIELWGLLFLAKMIDTLIYVMVVLIDTTAVENRFEKAFQEADHQFKIEMLKQASHEAAQEAARKAGKKTYKMKILDLYRKDETNGIGR